MILIGILSVRTVFVRRTNSSQTQFFTKITENLARFFERMSYRFRVL